NLDRAVSQEPSRGGVERRPEKVPGASERQAEVTVSIMNDYIRFSCPTCGKRLKAPPEHAGRAARCRCGQQVLVPSEAPLSVTEPARARPATSAAPPQPAPADVCHKAPSLPAPSLPPAPQHALRPFSAGLVMFLGLITCNVFAVTRLLWLHGKFP